MGYAAMKMGIRPWEWQLLTVEEADYVVKWCETQHAADEAD